MSLIQSILTPTGEVSSASLAASTSSSEIIFSHYKILVIAAGSNLNVRFGHSGMAAASAADYLVLANTPFVVDLGSQYDRIRIFNPDSAAAHTYYVMAYERA